MKEYAALIAKKDLLPDLIWHEVHTAFNALKKNSGTE